METFSALLALCVRGIHWSAVISPHEGQWRGVLMFSLICALTNGWANNWDTADLRRHGAHYNDPVAKLPACLQDYPKLISKAFNRW